MGPLDRRQRRVERRVGRLIYGTTVGLSLWAFYPGQLKDMAGRGWNVTAVACGDQHLSRAAVREGVASARVAMARDISLARDLQALAEWVLLLARQRPAVINLGTPKAGLLGGLAAKVTRVPRRLYVVHGLRFEGTTGARRALLVSMERLALWCATDVVVVSRSVGAGLRRVGVRRPLLLIGEGSCNGIDAEKTQRMARTVDVQARRETLGLERGTFVVGFVGRLTPDKGLSQLAEALRLLRSGGVEVTLLALGDAESDDAEAALREAGESVVLTGWVDEPLTYMSLMDVLVLPTKREGYPLVVLEANASGVPVVTTRSTGAIDSVEDGVDGLLVDYDDAPALAAQITRLVNDRALGERLAGAGRHRAEKRFASQRIWDGLDSIYRGRPNDDVRRLP